MKNERYTQQRVADELRINKSIVSKWMEETKRLIIEKAFEEEMSKVTGKDYASRST